MKDKGVIDDVSKLHETNIDKTDTEVVKIKHQAKHVVTGFM